MKKILLIAFALMMSLAALSLVVAQDADVNAEAGGDIDVAGAEMHEAAVMHVSLGAQVRLLQLEKEVLRRFLYGEQVLEYIDNSSLNITGENLAKLEVIVSELGDVKDEIVAELEKPANETTVEMFVSLKDRAINLTQEFRTILRESLSPEERKAMRDNVEEKKFPELEEFNGQIKSKIMEFNRNRVSEMLQNMGITDDDLMARLESGNITAAELKNIVKSRFRELNNERKQNFLAKVKMERARIQLSEHIAFAAKLGLGKDDVNRIRDLVKDENLTNQELRAKLGVLVKERLSERREVISQMRTRLQQMKENQQERIDDLRENMQENRERLQNRTDKIKGRLLENDSNPEEPLVDAGLGAGITGETE